MKFQAFVESESTYLFEFAVEGKKADYEYRYYKTNGNGAVQNRR